MRTGEWGEMVGASERAKAEERSKQKAQSLKWASLSVSLAADGKRWKEYQMCGEQERKREFPRRLQFAAAAIYQSL